LLFNVLFVMVYSSERGTTVIANHNNNNNKSFI